MDTDEHGFEQEETHFKAPNPKRPSSRETSNLKFQNPNSIQQEGTEGTENRTKKT